jgi:Fibronectin type III domain
MSIYPPTPGNRAQAIMMPQPATPTPVQVPTILPPNTPQGLSLAQGPDTDLTVTWSAPAADTTHGAATGYNLQYSPSGADSWTAVSNVTSPYVLSGLQAGTAIDVQIQSANGAGTSAWSATRALTTAAGLAAPNAPSIATVAPPPDGTNSNLTVTWTAPATDSSHGAAATYNLRYRNSGAGSWTTLSGVTSPYTVTGLTGATPMDVAVQAISAEGDQSTWSAIASSPTWGATIAPGSWVAAANQVHGANVAPNGGVNMTATPAPTEVTGAAFAWSTNSASVPTANLITAGPDGQTNGWGQWFAAPATPGTYYFWMLAQGQGGTTIGALVSSVITVS